MTKAVYAIYDDKVKLIGYRGNSFWSAVGREQGKHARVGAA